MANFERAEQTVHFPSHDQRSEKGLEERPGASETNGLRRATSEMKGAGLNVTTPRKTKRQHPVLEL